MDHMEIVTSHLTRLDDDQLRALIAHVAGQHAHRCGAPATAQTLRRVIDRLEEQNAHARMADIAWSVARRYGLTVDELKTRSSHRQYTVPRQEAMYLIRQVKSDDGVCRYSFPQIARFFGMGDHTTVIHAVDAHRRRLHDRRRTAHDQAAAA